MNETERYAWLQLAFTPHIGAESFLMLLQRFGSASAALSAQADDILPFVHHKQAASAWRGGEKRAQAQQAAEAALKWAMQDNCRLMLLGDEDYPVMLTEGITPPPVLFLRGNPRLLAKPAAAIVGSRHATPQAMQTAQEFGCAMVEKGIVVVSGMAAGIDTAAHQGALLSDGHTVAVWGTGIDRIYPQSNKQLAYQIAEKGLIISEFPLGTRPLAGHFPRRNRIIAALAHCTLVVEAAPESGSLITARLAAEMGREVMAVPGSIHNPHAKGCHKLIKEGAKLVECLDDIVQECPQLLQSNPLWPYSINKVTQQTAPEHGKPAEPPPAHRNGFEAAVSKPPYQPQERVVQSEAPEAQPPVPTLEKTQNGGNPILLDAMGYDPVHPDTLSERLGMAAYDVYAQLMELELDGMVAVLPGGRYQRVR